MFVLINYIFGNVKQKHLQFLVFITLNMFAES
jgi:hypothetical protein